MLDSDSARDALIDEVLTNHYVTRGFDSEHFLVDLEGAKSPLEALVNDLMGDNPFVVKLVDERHQRLLRFGLYQNIIGYGHKKRKLGDHYFFNHPFKAAQWRIAVAEERGETDLETLLSHIFILLAHDLVEEQVSDALKEEKKKIQERLQKEMEYGATIADLSAAGEKLRLSLPPDVEGLPGYEQRYRELLHREKSRERLKEFLHNSDLREPRLSEYFSALQGYVTQLREEVIQREKELIDEELGEYWRELSSGFDHHGFSRTMARRIFKAVHHMTRIGSELYYESVGKLFITGTLDAPVAKYLDRFVNTLDVDHQGTLRFFGDFTFDYFWHQPSRPRVDLGTVLSQQKASKRVEEEARELLSHERSRDLVAILSIRPEVAKQSGAQALDRVIYQLTAGNRAHQKPRAEREGRSEVKTQLRPHERLYQLYKNIILVTQDRKYHFDLETPGILQDLQQSLLRVTLKEAQRMVEQTFAYHCHPGSSFTLEHARRAYQGLQHYEQEGGLDMVTSKSAKKRNGEFSYDGVFARYFDQRVQGRKSAMDPLFHRKRDLFATALALHRLTEKYLQDPTFFLEGVRYHRLQLAEAIER